MGVLFLCLVLLVLLSRLGIVKKSLLLAFLAIGCVLSYYGVVLVLVFVLALCSLVKEVRITSIVGLVTTLLTTALWWKWTGIDELVTRYF